MKKLDDRLSVGDIVIHFKHEMDNDKGKYMYLITDTALHTETNEQLVIYQNIKTKESFARPVEMFLREVDREKYPDIKQKYRLEKVGEYQSLQERHVVQSYQVTDAFKEFCKKEIGLQL